MLLVGQFRAGFVSVARYLLYWARHIMLDLIVECTRNGKSPNGETFLYLRTNMDTVYGTSCSLDSGQCPKKISPMFTLLSFVVSLSLLLLLRIPCPFAKMNCPFLYIFSPPFYMRPHLVHPRVLDLPTSPFNSDFHFIATFLYSLYMVEPLWSAYFWTFSQFYTLFLTSSFLKSSILVFTPIFLKNFISVAWIILISCLVKSPYLHCKCQQHTGSKLVILNKYIALMHFTAISFFRTKFLITWCSF